MYNLYEDLKNDKICLSYMGIFTDKITTMLIDLSDSYITNAEHLNKMSFKVSFLIAECFQNVIRHGIIEKDNIPDIIDHKDFFQINILDDRIVLSSANLIEQKNVQFLDGKIDHLNSLDSNELKSLYLEVLDTARFSAKGGASLGLIEMVRKSGLPLKKRFISVTENYSLVFLSLEVPLGKNPTDNIIVIDEIEKSYRSLIDNKILILYKGDFSKKSISYLIDMLHNNFVGEKDITSEKLKNIIAIIEVMQNVSVHGKAINNYKEGIFTLSEIKGEIYIGCSNFINSSDYESFKRYIERIKASSIDEIEKLYKEKLSRTEKSEQRNNGLGLLEIARFTKNMFTYNFIKTPENEIFYSINIKTE